MVDNGYVTHFNHKNIVLYEHRPTNFNELIIENCKSMISEDDIILHLGDVIFSRQSELKAILEQIPGYKILIRGNHDKNKDHWYIEKGFNEIHYNYKINQILFSHHPLNISDFPGMKYNIHGHFHSLTREEVSRSGEGYPFYTKNHLLLSIEHENYKPILLEDFLSKNK